MARCVRRRATRRTTARCASASTSPSAWRIDGRANGYRGRDIMTPGDLATGINAQGSKDLERSTEDARLTGRVGAHDLSFTGYRRDGGQPHARTSPRPTRSTSPTCPYLSFESDLAWAGAAGQGLVELVAAEQRRPRRRLREGHERQPLLHAHGRSIGAVLGRQQQAHGRLLRREHAEARETVARSSPSAGAWITSPPRRSTTPLKTNFTPSESTFTVFNPSLGIKHELVKGLRGHFAVGRAFIPAEAIDADRASRRRSSADARRSARAIRT